MDAIPTKRLLFTVAIYAGLTAMAVAQPPGGRGGFGGPGGGGLGMLLRSDEVRTELELLDGQVDELQTIEEEVRDMIRSEMGGRGRRGGGDFQAMRARFEEIQKDVEERIAGVLTTQQMERLKQIQTQQQISRGGGRALLGGPLAESLGLTEEQQEQLRERAREVQAELQEKMAAARAEAQEKLLEVLTSEQREKLESMMGTPFTMTEQPGRGGGRRGGFQRGGRPAGPPPEGEGEL